MTELSTVPVTTLKGVGDAMAEKLAKVGLENLQDLLFHLPSGVIERKAVAALDDRDVGAIVTVALTPMNYRGGRTASSPLNIDAQDDQGGHVRFYDVPEIVRVAAPVYLKMGLRNAPNIYPVGAHLAGTAEALGRERVRRAELILRLLAEQDEG